MINIVKQEKRSGLLCLYWQRRAVMPANGWQRQHWSRNY